MLLQLPLTLIGLIFKTKVIQIFAFIGMELRETNPKLLDYLSHGIFKLALIFHYLSEQTQHLVAGHGLTGIKLDGPQLANKDLI
jgi:hypothetical protein